MVMSDLRTFQNLASSSRGVGMLVSLAGRCASNGRDERKFQGRGDCLARRGLRSGDARNDCQRRQHSRVRVSASSMMVWIDMSLLWSAIAQWDEPLAMSALA